MARSVTWSPQLSTEGSFASSASSITVRQSGGRPPIPQRRTMPPPSLKPPSFSVGGKPPMAPSSSRNNSQQSTNFGGPKAEVGLKASISNTSVKEVLNSTEALSSEASLDGEGWRKHGKLYRAKLIMEDEESGGNTFVLSNNCTIERYYQVAERVLDQFLQTSIDESADLTESYLIGNRLVKFLSTVLPTHHQYFSEDEELVKMRSKSQSQLVQLLQYLEQLARIIDEEELNKYILKDLNAPVKDSDKATEAVVKTVPSDESSYGSPQKKQPVQTNTSFQTQPSTTPEQAEESFELSSSPISNRSSHVLELDSTLSSSEESPPRSNEASPITDSNTTIETTLSFKLAQTDAKVIDNSLFTSAADSHVRLLQHDEASAWDDRFSQYGGENDTSKSSPRKEQNRKLMSRLPPAINENEVDDGNSVSFTDIAGEAQKFELQEDLFAMRSQYEEGEQNQRPNKPRGSLGSAWEPTTALSFPGKNAKPKKEKSDVAFVAPPGHPLYSLPVKETPPRVKHTPPIKISAKPSIVERETSPKSVLELGDWKADDEKEKEEMNSLFKELARPKELDESSLATNEAEEVSFILDSSGKSVRRNRLRHFRGCVRCLLE